MLNQYIIIYIYLKIKYRFYFVMFESPPLFLWVRFLLYGDVGQGHQRNGSAVPAARACTSKNVDELAREQTPGSISSRGSRCV